MERLVRSLARKNGVELVVVSGRGKGSHRLCTLIDANGAEVARFTLTGHPRDLSATVMRSIEKALEPIFGEKWTEKD